MSPNQTRVASPRAEVPHSPFSRLGGRDAALTGARLAVEGTISGN